MGEPREPRRAGPDERAALADALGDSPETVISIHLLRRGLCDAYLAGDPRHSRGLVVQNREDLGEPTAFGSDAATLWELLGSARGWWCVNVSATCAPRLGALVQEESGRAVRYYGDVYHTLTRPVKSLRLEAEVRLLDHADLETVGSSSPEVRGSGWGSTRSMLREGVAAGAIFEGRLVAIAYTSARSRAYADVSVSTLRGWRGRGLATSAAWLVIRELQRQGQVPVWSCGEENLPSMRVAHKLGFAEVLRRTYVILQGMRGAQ